MAVDNPQVVLNAIATARLKEINGKKLIVMPHAADEIKVLRNLGLKPPSINLDFHYTGRHQPFDHQRITTEFLVTTKRGFVLNDPGCVDCETEYLSPTGWKRIGSYESGQVAQWNPKTNQAEFVTPSEYIKRPCDVMLRFKTTRGVDQKLSHEHRVLFIDSVNRARVISAGEVKEADDRLVLGWRGRFLTTFKPPEREGIPLNDADLRVQIAVIADGHFSAPSTTNCVIRVKKERKKLRLRQLLAEAKIEFQELTPEYESAAGFSVFKFYAPWYTKYFDERFWLASERQLKIISEELHYWDGCERKADSEGFYTGDKESADFAQYVYVTNERTASLSVYDRLERGANKLEYVVHARASNRPLYLRGAHGKEEYKNITEEPTIDGFKYCFSVPTTFLILRRNGCVFITGNTGKTKAALWAAEYLRQKGKIRRVLIGCPLSVISVWEEECFNTVPHRSCCKLLGSKQRRLDILAEGSDICIINHDGISTIEEHLLGKFDLIIDDEATAHKNAQTQRYRKFKKLTVNVPYLWLMTGTPVTKAPTDAYALIKLVDPLQFKGSFTLFKDMTMQQVTSFKWVPRADSKEFVYKHMQPAVRFKKEDCLDLPSVTYVNRTCELTDQQRKAFDLMKQKLIMEQHDGEKITAANAAVKLLKLIQICCGVVKDNEGEHYVLDSSTRLNALEEIVEEVGGKVIIFVPFIGVMDSVQKFLQDKNWTVGLVNGSVSERARSKIFDDFQKGDLECLIAHPKTAAHGLNLTASSTIVWYGPIWSSEQYVQACSRINRSGQKNKMTIYHLIGSAIEAAIYRGLWGQIQMSTAILQQYEEVLK